MELMKRRREIIASQKAGGFNYLDPKTWFIARNGNAYRSPEIGTAKNTTIERVGNTVVLSRINSERGLAFLIGQLDAGVTYTLNGTFTNTGGKVYFCTATNIALDGNSYTYTVADTQTIVNNSVTFTPQTTGMYNFLLWNSGASDISAENVTLTAN